MLIVPKPEAALQQGDIIRDVPFIALPKVFNVKATGIQGQQRLDCQDLTSFEAVKQFSQDKALTAASLPFVLQPGMVVTQGCDIDFKDHITLARVFPIGHLLQDAKDAIEHDEPLVLHEVLRRLTEGHEASHLVYLGTLDGLGRYAADLLRVQSFPQPWKECFQKHRWMSLTDEGVKYVQGRLSESTGRFALTQGFWHKAGSEDGEIARRLAQEPGALEEAHRKLAEKKAASLQK